MRIPLDLIQASPNPIRTEWSQEGINELAQSIKENGLIQPVKVRPLPDGTYELVYGHRRTEASRQAGLTEIEAIVEGLDDTDTLIQALIENIQREDMNVLDKAKAIKRLKDVKNWSNMDIERHGIMSNGQASKLLALLNESQEVQEMVAPLHGEEPDKQITPKHIEKVSPVLKNETDKVAVLRKAQNEGLTAEQTRKVAESVAVARTPERKQHLLNSEYSTFQHNAQFVEERENRYGAHDPMLRDRTPRADQGWKEAPETKAVIDIIKQWQGLLESVQHAHELGKFSPEAKQFISNDVRKFAQSLLGWADRLEEEFHNGA